MLNQKINKIKLQQFKQYNCFFKLNQALVYNPKYADLSAEAKIVYAIMYDRLTLSEKNDWVDKDGSIYIYFSIQSIMDVCHCAEHKAVDIVKELRGHNLIITTRQGLGKPNKIYPLLVEQQEKEEIKTEEQWKQVEDYQNEIKTTQEEVMLFARQFGDKLVIDPEAFYDTMVKRGWRDNQLQSVENWKALFTTWNKQAASSGGRGASTVARERAKKHIPKYEDSKFEDLGEYMNFYFPIDPRRASICQNAEPVVIHNCPKCGSIDTYKHGSDTRYICGDCREIFDLQ